MTACSTARGGAGPGRATGAVRAVACAAVLLALATGCRDDTEPAWGYPRLGAALGSLSRALEASCAGPASEQCAADLDRLAALTERAFAEVLDHELLDAACVDARSEAYRARELRLAAARALPPGDPHDLPLVRAMAAERLAYLRLLTALETIRTAPPPGEGTEPV
ncbi:hypothetical protein ABZZ17_12490 [Streptomyces sp. NPDC006512]|uniref:hypothetical protein n=1 Tax=Streptomyces sp. NPDC006512 TaxID=3154307 RepID=UPI0033A8C572